MNSGVFVVIFIMGYFGVREWFWERGLLRMTAIFCLSLQQMTKRITVYPLFSLAFKALACLC